MGTFLAPDNWTDFYSELHMLPLTLTFSSQWANSELPFGPALGPPIPVNSSMRHSSTNDQDLIQVKIQLWKGLQKLFIQTPAPVWDSLWWYTWPMSDPVYWSPHPVASWEICMQVKKQQLELDVEQWTGSIEKGIFSYSMRKEYVKGCTLSLCLFNFYAEYIMWNAWLDETQAGIKIAGRNINNFRYTYDTMLMEESKEELKSLLMKVKEESEKADLKLNIQKTKIMAPLYGK